MKFVSFFTCLALVLCLFNIIEAHPQIRNKRSESREMCPKNSTPEECLAYATEKSKSLSMCQRFLMSGPMITWQSCGVVQCMGDLILIGEDLSKPYPDCCERCELY